MPLPKKDIDSPPHHGHDKENFREVDTYISCGEGNIGQGEVDDRFSTCCLWSQFVFLCFWGGRWNRANFALCVVCLCLLTSHSDISMCMRASASRLREYFWVGTHRVYGLTNLTCIPQDIFPYWVRCPKSIWHRGQTHWVLKLRWSQGTSIYHLPSKIYLAIYLDKWPLHWSYLTSHRDWKENLHGIEVRTNLVID